MLLLLFSKVCFTVYCLRVQCKEPVMCFLPPILQISSVWQDSFAKDSDEGLGAVAGLSNFSYLYQSLQPEAGDENGKIC